VRLWYRKPSAEVEPRVIHAAELVWVEGTLVYRGFGFKPLDPTATPVVRDFRIDRIERLEVLPSPWAYLEIPTLRFSFRLPAEWRYLAADFAPRAITWEPDGAFVVTLEEVSLLRAKRYVMRFGGRAEVIAPAALRAEVAAEAQAMVAMYRDA
jgi:predicted DNA-binding transcriptional regulator YafY